MQLSLLALRNPGKQKLFIAVGVLFLLFLVAAAVYRSATRKSVLSMSGKSEIDAALGLLGSGAGLQLKDFHRVQIKEGETVWEITARAANYLTQQRVTQISDPQVTVHRPKQPPLKITSRAAKLYMNGDDLDRAELEGEVLLDSQSGVQFKTENAAYDVQKRMISSPVEVIIFGNGYEVKGRGMEMPIDTELLKLLSDVETRVEARAKAPKDDLAVRRNKRK